MRQLDEVINQMLSVIPTDKTDVILRTRLVVDLHSHLDSIMYSAPELTGMRWNNVADTLRYHIPKDEKMWTTWQKEVVKIWMGE
jgi:DNA mismatch repair protein MutH